jgi:4-oxalocrotonate tautomerase
MPIVQINILAGRDEGKKERMIAEVTDAICRSLEVRPETVRVMINEMPNTNFGIGGVTAKKLGR